jgi:hypothetical protein
MGENLINEEENEVPGRGEGESDKKMHQKARRAVEREEQVKQRRKKIRVCC